MKRLLTIGLICSALGLAATLPASAMSAATPGTLGGAETVIQVKGGHGHGHGHGHGWGHTAVAATTMVGLAAVTTVGIEATTMAGGIIATGGDFYRHTEKRLPSLAAPFSGDVIVRRSSPGVPRD